MMKCRHCGSPLDTVFADLHFSPPCQSILRDEDLENGEMYYPLKVCVCNKCFLVQIPEVVKATNIFNEDYCYFSSYSTTLLKHSEEYVTMIVNRLNLNDNSYVMEIASNDGYLLQYFKRFNIPVIGIEPSIQTANAAIKNGIPTIKEFFNSNFARSIGNRADLIIGNNVLAHVPDINDFVLGMQNALKKTGTITMEFPHLLKLITNNEFDTIYHEHFSYLSLYTVRKIFNAFELEIYDVTELPIQGGSLRIYGKHQDNEGLPVTYNVTKLIEKEIEYGIIDIEFYRRFQERIEEIKYNLLEFLLKQKRQGKKVIGYGAAGKGNALLNYCGIKGTDLIKFVVDANPYKQGTFLAGSHIPVVTKEKLDEFKPDFVLILPWNLKEEIINQLSYIEEWGGKFVIPLPKLTVMNMEDIVVQI